MAPFNHRDTLLPCICDTSKYQMNNIVILVFSYMFLFDFADVVHLANLPLLTEFCHTAMLALAYFSLRDITLMPVKKRAEEDK